MLITGSLIFFLLSCGTYEPKKDTTISTAAQDVGIEIRDPSYNIKNPAKVIIYTVTRNKEEEDFLRHISEKLAEKGVETVFDHGQMVEYGNETFRIRTREKLMTFHHYLQIVGTGRKGQEPVIVDLKADTLPKLLELLMKVVFGE